jgi:low affinity Fe/Cu permease
MNNIFKRFAHKSSEVMGSPWAFVISTILVVMWAASGPMFDYSDTWQLVINTTTTVITFLMIFLVQNTQNRDTLSVHLKLDELIRSSKTANNRMLDLDQMSPEELKDLKQEFEAIARREAEGVDKLRKS